MPPPKLVPPNHLTGVAAARWHKNHVSLSGAAVTNVACKGLKEKQRKRLQRIWGNDTVEEQRDRAALAVLERSTGTLVKVEAGRSAPTNVPAEEAALCYARSPEAQAAVAAAVPLAPPPMTAEEALRQAEAQGLTLLRSESSSTGYKGVVLNSRSRSKPFYAQVRRGGKKVTLGYFATAEEAALHVVRASAAQAAAPQPPTTSSRKRKVKSEELPPDMPAGARVKLEELPPPMPPDVLDAVSSLALGAPILRWIAAMHAGVVLVSPSAALAATAATVPQEPLIRRRRSPTRSPRRTAPGRCRAVQSCISALIASPEEGPLAAAAVTAARETVRGARERGSATNEWAPPSDARGSGSEVEGSLRSAAPTPRTPPEHAAEAAAAPSGGGRAHGGCLERRAQPRRPIRHARPQLVLHEERRRLAPAHVRHAHARPSHRRRRRDPHTERLGAGAVARRQRRQRRRAPPLPQRGGRDDDPRPRTRRRIGELPSIERELVRRRVGALTDPSLAPTLGGDVSREHDPRALHCGREEQPLRWAEVGSAGRRKHLLAQRRRGDHRPQERGVGHVAGGDEPLPRRLSGVQRSLKRGEACKPLALSTALALKGVAPRDGMIQLLADAAQLGAELLDERGGLRIHGGGVGAGGDGLPWRHSLRCVRHALRCVQSGIRGTEARHAAHSEQQHGPNEDGIRP